MRGQSRASLAEAEDRLEALLGDLPTAAARIHLAEDLFAVVRLLDATPALRRALTDPARSGDDKAALAGRLLADRVGRDSAALVGGVVRQRWGQGRDVADALETLGVVAVLAAAESGDRLGEVEDEVFRFERLVAGDADLRRALGEERAPERARAALADRLLDGRSQPETAVLARHVATAPRGRHPEDALGDILGEAARRRERLVAQVTSAAILTEAQRERLAAALGRRHGRPVRLALDVDPGVVGGLRVQVGDDVYDGTLSRRFSDAAERLAR